MRVPRHFLRIPCIHAVSQRPYHGPVQGPDYPRLAQTSESQGCSILPRFCQLLLSFHLQILQNHSSTYTSYLQGYTWHFSDECRSAFKALKKAFTTAPVL